MEDISVPIIFLGFTGDASGPQRFIEKSDIPVCSGHNIKFCYLLTKWDLQHRELIAEVVH